MWLMASDVCAVAECLLILVGCPKRRKRGCRRLVAIGGRDGAAAASREVSHTRYHDEVYESRW